MYRVILFDLWNTLATIVDLDDMRARTKEKLGEERYATLVEFFILWQAGQHTREEFLHGLDKAITLSEEERDFIDAFITPPAYKIFDETESVLQRLNEEGYRLGVLSNSPPTSKNAFERFALGQYFEHILFSCDLGLMKPDPACFQAAVDRFAVQPEDVLMVGDTVDTDMAGATQAGLGTLLIDRKNIFDYQQKINSLDEIFSFLSISS